MRAFALLLCASLLLLTPPAAAREHEILVAVELAPSLDEPALAYGMQLGYRSGRLGARVRVEHSTWLSFDTRPGFFAGSLDVSLGGELLHFERRAVTSLYVGTATLLGATALDDAGSTGLFVDVRPLGLRWRLGGGTTLRLDPLHLAVVAPVLDDIPLVQVQYRTTLAVEWSL